MKTMTSAALIIMTVLSVAAVQFVAAAGTPAGTVIQSRSKVVYTTASGVSADTAFSNIVSFTVGQVAAVNITPVSNAQTTVRDSIFAEYALTVTNSGNGTDQFTLSSLSSKGWGVSYYFDTNGDGVLQPEELSAGTITQTGNIAADGTYKFFARIFVPKDPSLNGQTDTTNVTVTSVFDAEKANTAQARTTVNTVNFSDIGNGLSVNPTNPSPGQNVVYSLTLTNNGSVPATGVSFTDLINSGQFSLVSANTTQGTVNTSGNPIAWTVGTINPGGSVTVTITLQVNAGLTNGTILSNTLSAVYTVGGVTFTVTSNNPPAAIGVIRGVEIAPLVVSAAKEPEDTLSYAFTIKNTGNAKDVLEMELSSSKSYNWAYYRDVNQNGLFDTGDTPLTNTNAAGGVDADSVNAYDSVKVLARLIVPNVPADQTQDVTTFSVKSSFDPTKFQSANGTTTINIPDVVLVRTFAPSGTKVPGTEVTFTVTYQNTGHGKAYNAVITETEPDNMTYAENSVTVNGAAATDLLDDDAVTVTTVSGKKVITISLGTLTGLSSLGTISFKATIN
jgi:uncharacterized repeat protein (TIGR01451 family)